jgi:hypothetical protein
MALCSDHAVDRGHCAQRSQRQGKKDDSFTAISIFSYCHRPGMAYDARQAREYVGRVELISDNLHHPSITIIGIVMA